MASAPFMFNCLARAVRLASREESFVAAAGARGLPALIGTATYTVSEGWSLIDGYCFAVGTLTTSTIPDPELILKGTETKLFTVFCTLTGIGILLKLVR